MATTPGKIFSISAFSALGSGMKLARVEYRSALSERDQFEQNSLGSIFAKLRFHAAHSMCRGGCDRIH